MIDTIIFDLEGTLVDTSSQYRLMLCEKTAAYFGYSRMDQELADKIWYDGDRSAIIQKELNILPSTFWKKFDQGDFADLRKYFTRVYLDHTAIPELRKMGMKTGVVTGTPRKTVDMQFKYLDKSSFDAVVLTHEGFRPKPDPAALLHCIKLLGSHPSRTAYVGNGDEDRQCAANAGALDILIRRPEYDYQGPRATLMIDGLHELLKLREISHNEEFEEEITRATA